MLIFQVTDGAAVAPETAARMATVKSLAEGAGSTYLIVAGKGGLNILLDRQTAMLEVLCKEPQAFYVDADMILKSIPSFDKNDLPYLAKHPSGMADDMLCYVNGNTEFFTSLYKEKELRGIPDMVWWFRKIIRDRKVNFIDEACFDSSFTRARDEAILGIHHG
jgi:hypothetical protein